MAALSHWSEQYVGLPYAVADCAALAAKVQLEVFGAVIKIPEARAGNVRALSEQIIAAQTEVATPIAQPVEGCAVLMMGRGRLNHVGVFTCINGIDYVLHAMRSAKQTVLHKICDLPKQGLTLEGYYRWN
ncbi:MAG: hypothetical protein OEY11_12235 [Gammaproteobacteria bacterium]|nr:hypothetical protein [Gammaproteobacteria bacterium]